MPSEAERYLKHHEELSAARQKAERLFKQAEGMYNHGNPDWKKVQEEAEVAHASYMEMRYGTQ